MLNVFYENLTLDKVKVTLMIYQHWYNGKKARQNKLVIKSLHLAGLFVVRLKISSVRCSQFLESLTQLFVRLVRFELLSLYPEITPEI